MSHTQFGFRTKEALFEFNVSGKDAEISTIIYTLVLLVLLTTVKYLKMSNIKAISDLT